MVQSAGFDPSIVAFSSTEQRRPPEREPNATRITPATEQEATSADSRRRLESADTPPRPTRIAFTAKFGPDSDGFPLQLISGDQVRGADSNDSQVIVENRISRERASQDSQTALLQAQESRDAVASESRRQQEAATESRREENANARVDTEPRESNDPTAASGSVLDLQV